VPLPFPGSEMPRRQMLDAMAARIGGALREDPMRPTPVMGSMVIPAPAAAPAKKVAKKAPAKGKK
jgi:hypothetical protein